jgi:hypothetical protein
MQHVLFALAWTYPWIVRALWRDDQPHTLTESALPVAYYSSYSVDRPKRAQTGRRARVAVTILWALSLAMFIAVGSAWADAGGVPNEHAANPPGKPDHTVCHDPSGQHPMTKLVHDDEDVDNSYSAHIAHGDTEGACPEVTPVVDQCTNETLNPGVQASGPCVTLVTVCRSGETVSVRSDSVLGTDADGACAVVTDVCDDSLNPGVQAAGPCVTLVTVCRDGVTTTIHSDLKQAGDIDGACAPDAEDDVTCTEPSFNHGGTCKVIVCNPSAQQDKTQEIDYAAYLKDHFVLPVNGSCAAPVDECAVTATDVNGDCITDTVVCNEDSTSPGPHSLPYECQADTKVNVCHTTGEGDFNLLSINQHALAAHLKHGDHLPVGESCITVREPADACPDDLNPGIQETGTKCVTASIIPVVDACPDDALNPGVQTAGTTCVVAAAPAAPAAAEAAAPAAADTAVDAAADDADAADAAEPAAADAAVAGAGDAADAATDDDLPFTGFSATSVTLAGVLMLILGMFGHANALRAGRRRTARSSA